MQKSILSIVRERSLLVGCCMDTQQTSSGKVTLRALWIENVNHALLIQLGGAAVSNMEVLRLKIAAQMAISAENVFLMGGTRKTNEDELTQAVLSLAVNARAAKGLASMATMREKRYAPLLGADEDHELTILRFDDMQGAPIALLVNAMLPPSCPATEVSSRMERLLGGTVVLTLSGACIRKKPLCCETDAMLGQMAQLATAAVNPVKTPAVTVAMKAGIGQLIIGRTIFFMLDEYITAHQIIALRQAFPNDRMLIFLKSEAALPCKEPDELIERACIAMRQTVDVSRELPQVYLDAVKQKYLDVAYDHASPLQRMDVWLPENAAQDRLPVIVYFHGGAFAFGWQRGSDAVPMLCGLDRGYAVVSAQYRLSGEACFPAAAYDAKAVLRYLREHADEYGIDSERISLWGASAGAWLAAFTAVTAGNPAFEDLEHGAGGGNAPGVCCVVCWCGPFDMAAPAAKQMTAEEMEMDARSPFSAFLGAPAHRVPELCRLASPATYVDAKTTPPFLLVHGTGDELVSIQQSLDMERLIKLKCGDGAVETLYAQHRPHHGDSWMEEPWVIERCLNFIGQHVRKKAGEDAQ